MPETIDPAAEIERISERIRTMVDERFGRGEARVYLSSLGSLLGEDRATLERLSKRRFGEFVEKVLGYTLGKTGQNLNVLYIDRPEALGPATEPVASKPPKFNSDIWNAFKTPTAEGERRFVNVATGQVVEAADAGGDVHEIPAERLSREGRPSPEVAEVIRSWVEAEGLDLALFLAARPRRDEAGPTLLHQLLEALDGEQLRRTTLPLDVIKTLSERRGG